jgi:hypothetical protein
LFETVCCSKVIRRKDSLLQPYVPDLSYTEHMEDNGEMNLLMSKKQHVFCAKCFEWTWSLEMADGDYGIMHLEVLNPSDEFFLSHFLQALSREPAFNHTSSIAWSDCPP